MRVVIVEDEKLARDLIKEYLSTEKDIKIIGEFTDGFSGAVAINNTKPDLVLLDIQLPRLNGFEMLEVLDYTPQIIFTTAFDEYAIKAFEQNATDYLLKPFSRDRFSDALQKAREKLAANLALDKPANKLGEDLASSTPLNRIVVKDLKGIHVIPIEKIEYIEAQDDYLMIYSSQGRFIKKQTMKSLEERLNPSYFLRVHRSYIVNLHTISRIEPYEKESHIALLKSGARVRVSNSGYKNLKNELDF